MCYYIYLGYKGWCHFLSCCVYHVGLAPTDGSRPLGLCLQECHRKINVSEVDLIVHSPRSTLPEATPFQQRSSLPCVPGPLPKPSPFSSAPLVPCHVPGLPQDPWLRWQHQKACKKRKLTIVCGGRALPRFSAHDAAKIFVSFYNISAIARFQ